MDNKVIDGFYVFYIKDDALYPVMMNVEQWHTLQNSIVKIMGEPVQVIEKPLHLHNAEV